MYAVTLFTMVHFCCIRRPFFSVTAFWWSLKWSLDRSLTVLLKDFDCRHVKTRVCLGKNKILDWSKFKAFADNKIKVAKKKKNDIVFHRVENIVGSGENVG